MDTKLHIRCLKEKGKWLVNIGRATVELSVAVEKSKFLSELSPQI